MAQLEHLSPSTAKQYHKCGKQVFFRKVQGLPDNTKYAVTQYGSAMHEANEEFFNHKLEGKLLSLIDYKDLFIQKYGYLADLTTIWKADTKEHLLGEGLKAAEEFYNMWGTNLRPQEVEHEYHIERPNGGWPIKCFTDLTTVNGTVLDYKYGRGFGGVQAGDFALAMSTYAEGYRQEHGNIPKVGILKHNWKRSKGLYYFAGFDLEFLPIDESWIAYAMQNYDDVQRGIENDIFMPIDPESSGLCKGCAYRKICDVPAFKKASEGFGK